ncbi:MAG: Hsp33 family molecular chaperone HslO [Lentisphaeria bacterium]|nr:Hsp33 family molecular chaperone HslO [Lentisphaeria bacterium]MBR7143520.1 Hsp33 family molecular chaperone HslO [Lentisphaeria bacterium]
MEQDCLIRGLHTTLNLRAVWAETTDLVNAGITTHDTDPAAAMAFANALSAAAVSAAMLDEGDRFSIRCEYPGTLRGMIIESAADGAIRGVPFAPHPLDGGSGELGELYGDNDGMIYVTRSTPDGKILNSGQTRAPLADPANDLAFFFCVSNQIETEIRTWAEYQGDPQRPVKRMSALMLQAMPDCDLEVFSNLRNAMHGAAASEIRNKLDFDNEPEKALKTMLAELAHVANVPEFDASKCVFTTGVKPRWQCRCSEESMRRAMTVLGKKDLEKLFEERPEPEIKCNFCCRSYRFKKEDFF